MLEKFFGFYALLVVFFNYSARTATRGASLCSYVCYGTYGALGLPI